MLFGTDSAGADLAAARRGPADPMEMAIAARKTMADLFMKALLL